MAKAIYIPIEQVTKNKPTEDVSVYERDKKKKDGFERTGTISRGGSGVRRATPEEVKQDNLSQDQAKAEQLKADQINQQALKDQINQQAEAKTQAQKNEAFISYNLSQRQKQNLIQRNNIQEAQGIRSRVVGANAFKQNPDGTYYSNGVLFSQEGKIIDASGSTRYSISKEQAQSLNENFDARTNPETFTKRQIGDEGGIPETAYFDSQGNRVSPEVESQLRQQENNQREIQISSEPTNVKLSRLKGGAINLYEKSNERLKEITIPISKVVLEVASGGKYNTFEEAKLEIDKTTTFLKTVDTKDLILNEAIREVNKVGSFVSKVGIIAVEDAVTVNPARTVLLLGAGAGIKAIETGIVYGGVTIASELGLLGGASKVSSGFSTVVGSISRGVAGYEALRITAGVGTAGGLAQAQEFLGKEISIAGPLALGYSLGNKLPGVSKADKILTTLNSQEQAILSLEKSGTISKQGGQSLRAGLDLELQLRKFKDVPVREPSTSAIPKDLTTSEQEVIAKTINTPDAELFGSQSIRLRRLQELGGDVDLAVPKIGEVLPEAQSFAKEVSPNVRTGNVRERGGSIGFGGEKAIDIKPVELVESFGFKQEATLKPDKVKISRLSEQFTRNVSGLIELRHGGKDVGGAIISARGLIQQQAISLAGKEGISAEIGKFRLRNAETNLIKFEQVLPEIKGINIATGEEAKGYGIIDVPKRVGFVSESPDFSKFEFGIKNKRGSRQFSIFEVGTTEKGKEPSQLKIGKRSAKAFGEIDNSINKRPKGFNIKSSDFVGTQKPSSFLFSSFGKSQKGISSSSTFSNIRDVKTSIVPVATFSTSTISPLGGKGSNFSPSKITNSNLGSSKISGVKTTNRRSTLSFKTNPTNFGKGKEFGKEQLNINPKPQNIFSVQVRRRGKFKTIALSSSQLDAFNIGRERVSSTLGATFRVTGGSNLPTPIGFYRSGKSPNTFIEKNKFRLSRSTELAEIQAFKRGAKIRI